MSDFDFDDDSFLVDDSFLAEVDNIASKATTGTSSNAPSFSRPSALMPKLGPSKSVATKSAPPGNARAGPSRLPFAKPARPPQPSSDDYDDMSLPAESFAVIDSIAARSKPTVQPRLSTTMPTVIPSSRLGMTRTSSGSGGSFMQTHLNFRRDNQGTKGKRWDRTAFAETGRRIDAKKAKAKGKAGSKGKGRSLWDDEAGDELDEEEDEWDEPLAPHPKPLVDIHKPYEPQRHFPISATMGTYIYPTNRPKRDYQYEIVQACFMDNCLVALPTGLGKTFVAGVVMLNFYRWFPTGKIIFLAHTRPLVNQQIEACQTSCGIPSKDAAVMTGQSASAKERARLWEERRVFYCTPQTFDNDLKKGVVDPRDIVLVVFGLLDEAHKASGSYAYTTLLAFLMAHTPYFRVLALTATPGSTVEKVQDVVDALHISRIEIREAEAPEIRKYMNEKRTEKHVVPMGEVVTDFRDRWVDLMRPYVAKLVQKDILTDRDLDVKRLKTFRLTMAKRSLAGNQNLRWAYGSLTQIEAMARAMGYLLEFSIGMFHTELLKLSGGSNPSGKKTTSKGGANGLRNNFEFQKLLRDVEAELNCIRIGQRGKSKADKHPKMVKTLELLLDHFTQAEEDGKTLGEKNDTRAMVFCSYRDCVLEVVDMLNQHSGMLRATKFVGQSQGKSEGDKGFTQKDQKKTIQEFKEGKFNILVSTSIGEEGLDIGEVDFVVIYDMPKQSIKLLQRVGRTGRKRSGKVHVLMSENREDTNWESAQQNHREIQEEILHSRNLELFEDVEPLLLRGKFPQCVEQEMPVDAWDPDGQKPKRKASTSTRAAPRSKKAAKGVDGDDEEPEEGEELGPPRKRQRGHEIPEDAHEGFKSVAELLRDKGKAKGKGRAKKEVQRILSESESDESVEDKLSKAPCDDSAPAAGRRATIEEKRSAAAEAAARRKRMRDEEEAEQARRQKSDELNRAAIDFFNTVGPVRRTRTAAALMTPPSSPPTSSAASQSPQKYPLSPPTDESNPSSKPLGELARLTPRTAAAVGFSQVDPIDLSFDDELSPAPPPRLLPPARPALEHAKSTDIMPPPPVPSHRLSSPSDTSTPNLPRTQFPVRRLGLQRKRAVIPSSTEKSETGAGGSGSNETPAAPGRLKRRYEDSSPLIGTSPVERYQAGRPNIAERPLAGGAQNDNRSRSRKRAVPAAQMAELLDLDAGVSDASQASSDTSTEASEDESDRAFAGRDFAPTQAPKGYNQRAVYVAGLGTQAPQHGLEFKKNGAEERAKWLSKARAPVLVTDDEGDSGASENEYELGSFVVNDEDVDFDSQSQQPTSDAYSCT